MKNKKFLTAEFLIQIVKHMDQVQLRNLQNRINIAFQLKIEYLGLFMEFQEDYPFFQIYLGTNIKNEKQEFLEMIKAIQDRQSLQFENVNQIESKKAILGLLSQNNDNMKIKMDQIQELIEFAFKNITQYKWNLHDEINKHTPYSYQIDDIDSATKNELIHPFFCLKLDSLLILPALVNQSTFFNFIIKEDQEKQKKALSQQNKISNQSVIYLFEIRDLLQQDAKAKLQIEMFPALLNFNFIRKDNQKPYFLNNLHFEKFVEQNSRTYAQTKKNISYFEEYLEQNNKIKLNIFKYYPFDEIGQGLILVQNKHKEDYPKEFEEYWQSLYKQKYPTKRNVDSVQIKAVSFEYLHSLNCYVKSNFEYIQHIIDPESMICKYCKEQIDDYGTLFYDITFYQFYQSFKEILLSPYYRDIPGVYICPITLNLIGTKKNFMISSQILNQKGEHLITLYNQLLKFELCEEFDAEQQNDDEHYEIMNSIRDTNQEQILEDEAQLFEK